MSWVAFVATPVASAIVSSALIVILHPVLARYALARPNARSSHTTPTPQGGGLAVVAATIVGILLFAGLTNTSFGREAVIVITATLAVTAMGAFDDLRPLSATLRLALQGLAVAAVLAALPQEFRIVHALPWWCERVLLLIAGVWFVNLVNFMDGLDWMTVAEIVPVTAALALFGWVQANGEFSTTVALALGGAMIGFAPFNRPTAKLFLGDVGSLPVGLLTGWCLLQMAGAGHLTAALLLPLYYLADATVTLFRRAFKREAVWVAHRSHFYQRATDNGYSVIRIVSEVFVLNIALGILAAISIFAKSAYSDAVVLALGCLSVGMVLLRFSRPRNAASIT